MKIIIEGYNSIERSVCSWIKVILCDIMIQSILLPWFIANKINKLMFEKEYFHFDLYVQTQWFSNSVFTELSYDSYEWMEIMKKNTLNADIVYE